MNSTLPLSESTVDDQDTMLMCGIGLRTSLANLSA